LDFYVSKVTNMMMGCDGLTVENILYKTFSGFLKSINYNSFSGFLPHQENITNTIKTFENCCWHISWGWETHV